MLLSESFLEKYKNIEPPMTELGMFVYYRTYSRWLDGEKRREYWWETVRRTVEYIFSLEQEIDKNYHENRRWEAQLLFDNIFNLKQFPSGRTLWIGGTEAARKFPTSNFNCSYITIDSFECFSELYYLLMVGTGAGFRTLPSDVEKMDSYRTNIKMGFIKYQQVDIKDRVELTSFSTDNEKLIITVGDSKEGWVSALDIYFKTITSFLYRKIEEVLIDFSNVRPKGERLKTFGGTASGYESLTKRGNPVQGIGLKNLHLNRQGVLT
jgi:ribonucleoside-diphosphate reductase alpha chain/ribonucleoside-triphosphate reductase